MRLSARTDYGLRATLELAAHYGRGPLQTQEIASRQDMPARFLEQLMLALRRAGIVESKRGAGGGYSLARPAGEITLRDVVEALEGKMALLGCMEDDGETACKRAGACAIREALKEAHGRMLDALAERSVADLLERTAELAAPAGLTYEI